MRYGRTLGCHPLPESSAGREHWRGALVDGVDDLAAVDPFEVNARDAEVRVPEVALDDDQGNALARHLDGVGVAQLVLSEATPDAGSQRRRRLRFVAEGAVRLRPPESRKR
jgi:hypothetical protein